MIKSTTTHYFYNLKFIKYQGTYLPRYETEYLIELLDICIKKYNIKCNKIIDACSGSGCIAISISNIYKNNKNINILSIEKDFNVVKNLKENISNHSIKNISVINNDIHNIKNIKCDILVSNPPYIKYSDALKIANNQDDMRNISGGKDGNDIIFDILNNVQAKIYIFELGYIEQIYKISQKINLIEFYHPLENLNVYFCAFSRTL